MVVARAMPFDRALSSITCVRDMKFACFVRVTPGTLSETSEAPSLFWPAFLDGT
jgi:hypothetical protein